MGSVERSASLASEARRRERRCQTIGGVRGQRGRKPSKIRRVCAANPQRARKGAPSPVAERKQWLPPPLGKLASSRRQPSAVPKMQWLRTREPAEHAVLPFASRPTRTTLRGAPNWRAGPRCIEAARPAPMRPVRAGGAAPSPARKTALRPSASPKHRASQSRQSAVPPDADCWRECSNPAPKESREGTDASRPMGYLRCGLMGLMYRCSVTLGNIGTAIVGMVTR